MHRARTRLLAAAALTALGAAVLAIAPSAQARDDEEVLINWKFQAGEVRGFRQTSDVRIKTTPRSGEAETFHQRQTNTGYYSVVEVDAAGQSLNRIEHRDVTLDMTMGGNRYGWDSTADWAKEHAKAESLKTYVDLIREFREFNVQTVKGKVSNMRFRQNPEGVARFPYQTKVTDKDLNDPTKLDRFTRITQGAFDSYSNRKVKVGDSWSVTAPRQVAPGVVAEIQTTYTLLEVVPYRGARCARLAAKLDFSLPDGAKGQKIVSSDGKGEMFWDLDGGYLVSSWIDEKLLVTADLPGRGEAEIEVINRQEFRCLSGKSIPD